MINELGLLLYFRTSSVKRVKRSGKRRSSSEVQRGLEIGNHRATSGSQLSPDCSCTSLDLSTYPKSNRQENGNKLCKIRKLLKFRSPKLGAGISSDSPLLV